MLSPSLADGASLDSTELALVGRVNEFRAARGLPTLAVSDTLTAAAKWMSADMAVNDYFAHRSQDGRSPTQRMADAGYPAFGTWTGEDLAAGYTATADVLAGDMPPELVEAHLKLDRQVMDALRKDKVPVVPA